MNSNPGRVRRTQRRIERSQERSLFARLGSFIKGKKGTPSYYAQRNRRRKSRR